MATMENSKGACPVHRSAQAESRTSLEGVSFKSSFNSASCPPNIRREASPDFPPPPISATPFRQDIRPYLVESVVNLPRLACSKLSLPRTEGIDRPSTHNRPSPINLFKDKRIVFMVCFAGYIRRPPQQSCPEQRYLPVRFLTHGFPLRPAPLERPEERPVLTFPFFLRKEPPAPRKSRDVPGKNWNSGAYNNEPSEEPPCPPV